MLAASIPGQITWSKKIEDQASVELCVSAVRDGLKTDAKHEAKDKAGKTALMHAAAHQNLGAIKALAAVSQSNERDALGRTALHHSMMPENDLCIEFACVNALLEMKADPNIVDQEGRTPLHHAAKYPRTPLEEYPHDKVIEAMCAAGADVTLCDKSGFTALAHYVSTTEIYDETKVLACVKLLAGKAENNLIENATVDKTPALLLAMKRDIRKLPHAYVRALLAANADPNVTDSAGKTPLFYAVSNMDFESAHALIAANARVTPELMTVLVANLDREVARLGIQETLFLVDLLLTANAPAEPTVFIQLKAWLERAKTDRWLSAQPCLPLCLAKVILLCGPASAAVLPTRQDGQLQHDSKRQQASQPAVSSASLTSVPAKKAGAGQTAVLPGVGLTHNPPQVGGASLTVKPAVVVTSASPIVAASASPVPQR